jgi:hypothetical protein
MGPLRSPTLGGRKEKGETGETSETGEGLFLFVLFGAVPLRDVDNVRLRVIVALGGFLLERTSPAHGDLARPITYPLA